MKRFAGKFAGKIPAIVFAVLVAVILLAVVPYTKYSISVRAGGATPAREITQVTSMVNGKEQTLALPCTIRNLEPRTEVRLRFEIMPRVDDYMQIRVALMPFHVLVNGKRIYSYGNKETRPSFMRDPAENIVLLPIGEAGRHSTIELVYRSPVSRKFMEITAPVISNQSGIIRWDMVHYGLMFSLGVVFVILGLVLLLMALFVIPMDRKGSLFLWLGLFAIDTGLWNIGESGSAIFYVNDPTLIYMISYISFMTVLIPIGMIIYHGCELTTTLPLKVALGVCFTADVLAIVLQLAGLVMLNVSCYLFQFLTPAILGLYLGMIARDIRRRKRRDGVWYMLPYGSLFVAAIFELTGKQRHTKYVVSSYFQIGVLLFFIFMCINAALQVRRGIRLRLKEEQQEFEIHLLEYQIKEQRKHQQALVENQKKLRRQRHDLRHQLTVIRDYNLENRRKELDDFIESLLADIPLIREVRYCENDAVNAVIAYYISGASREGIRTDVQIAVPQKIRDVSDKALCIIFGNLLENAIEACQRMTPESEKYIRLRSMIHLDTLVITMENTYNGKVRKWGKKFVSSKREEIGIGLSSIESIVKAVDGEARFEPEETVFRSMVYLRKPARDRSRGAEKKYEEGAVPQTTV